MDWWPPVAMGIVLGALALYLYVRTLLLALRFNSWVMAPLVLVDVVSLFLGFGGALFYLGGRLWLLSTLTRWEPLLGLFPPAPSWPRAPRMRGARRPRQRRIPEPMPWTRGPHTW
jgi:hypothetical protein